MSEKIADLPSPSGCKGWYSSPEDFWRAEEEEEEEEMVYWYIYSRKEREGRRGKDGNGK